MHFNKAQIFNEQTSNVEGFQVTAFNTAEEYNLESINLDINKFLKYMPSEFNSEFESSVDALHAVSTTDSELNSKQLFLFRDGSVVMWNVPKSEIKTILDFIKNYELNSFNFDIIQNESEVINYSYSSSKSKTQIINNSLVFSNNENLTLEKFAVSNALALSVQLGTFEANLEQYIDEMKPVTEDLKLGKIIKVSRDEVLQKTGQLFALRHSINLNSDLLDTPDFYWDREELEKIYQSVFSYYCINKRTKVINEKLNHCLELVDLLSSHLNDKHHTRLEWMIIILIMVEVVFEIFHFIEK
ncbi:conserved hypothetical protein [Pediculus humanus corporis]|uniref:DUF155 domain-containing protein n=1 Tax=Pediculus humanus subsp. corporis TaxID=121224 RepID=E0VHP6_PEDHC|nr:uncharacterized protein Phum_PHUM214100 [Pediculus humanus corporis]EEB12932.1 conserved hypothetical protein [Pediculus humanus corporis]